jgi:hypothetical protein
MPALWVPVLAKGVSTALIVVLASVLAEAVGPFWGALVASMPVSSGPAYVFLAMQHDGEFVAASALSGFAANAATGMLLIVYAIRASRPRGRPLSAAISTWLAVSVMIRQIGWTPTTALLLNLVVYGMGFLMLRHISTSSHRNGRVMVRRRFDLPVRATAVALFVSAVVVASSLLGPGATGAATAFPISLISVIIISRPRIGRAASALLAVTALRAMLGFGLALLVLHLAIRPWGVTPALSVALFVSLSWSAGLLALNGRLRPS